MSTEQTPGNVGSSKTTAFAHEDGVHVHPRHYMQETHGYE